MAEVPDQIGSEQNRFSETDPRWGQLSEAIAQAECFPQDSEVVVSSMREVVPFTGTNAYLVEVDDGTDILIAQQAPIPDMAEGWHRNTDITNYPINPHNTLRGVFSQRRRQLVQPDGNVYVFSVLTGPKKFNATMEALGFEPGEDCIRMEGRAGGHFSGADVAKSDADLTILADLSQEYEIFHDRDAGDHEPVWWATPTRKALAIQQVGAEVRDSADPQDVKDYAHGLDMLVGIKDCVLDVVSEAVDGPWVEDETAESRAQTIQNHIDKLCGPIEKYDTSNSIAYNALIKMGFIPGMSMPGEDFLYEGVPWPKGPDGNVDQDSPVVQGAREVLREWLLDYAANIADMLERADGLVGLPDGVNLEQRRLLIQELSEVADEQYSVIHGTESEKVYQSA